MKKLALSECFYSIQGEGKTMGVPAVFLRLSGCNLMCGGMGTQFDGELHNGAKWRCDTVEVWMKGSAKEYGDILDKECLEALEQGAHLVVTGGEPLMQQEALTGFFKWLYENVGYVFIEVETNGTLMPERRFNQYVNLYNCSPKLSNSGNAKEARYNLDVLKFLGNSREVEDSIFKFVISSEEDFKEIRSDFLPHLLIPSIYLMPAGESQGELLKTRLLTVKLAKQYRLNYTERLHIVIWNKKTGV